jgi:primosomal protein N' (replication factor Y)
VRTRCVPQRVSNPGLSVEPGTGSWGPIARVRVDLPIMHLDRNFDYVVPDQWDTQAVPGARVRVRFAGKLRDAYVMSRSDVADVESPKAIERVIDSIPPLTTETLNLVQQVADRFVGTFWDVARSAVPGRHARAERTTLSQDADQSSPPTSAIADDSVWDEYVVPEHYWLDASRGPQRYVWASAPASDFAREITSIAQQYRRQSRGVVIVVPDAADIHRVRLSLESAIPSEDIAELTADAGPERRYREFLRIRTGLAGTVVGTRNAVFAPVKNLGAVIMWDDGDDVFREPHAPYWDAREVAALRSHESECDLFVGAPARSIATQWWCDSGWAHAVEPKRPPWWVVRAIDDREVARDPAARSARIPTLAWQVAREGLDAGPVLVQVSRRGYLPVLACQGCRQPAVCSVSTCQGSLEISSGHAIPRCRRCGTLAGSWSCPRCGDSRVRAVTVGAGRTAEELGRAFPGVPIVWSEADRIVREVDCTPALVIATPGAEPRAVDGYRAVILLDARAAFPSLAGAEQLVRRWFAAARLIATGGQVCVVADPSAPEVQALTRWDSRWFAQRELDERKVVGLPPITRVAEVIGPPSAVSQLQHSLELPLRILGPVETGTNSGVRTFFVARRADASELTSRLNAALRTASLRESAIRDVRVRMDPRDM